jgi:sugar phosphate isomerase/epimerase
MLHHIHPESVAHTMKIGLQLYTVRNLIATEFEKTMRRVADIGFLGIESCALPPNLTVERAARVFKDLELEVLGMHTPLPVGDKRDALFQQAEAYGCTHAVFSGRPDEAKNNPLDTLQRTVALYDEIADALEKQGLHFGLHNHWWEFDDHKGQTPFYYLLEHLDTRVFFEIDTYWVKAAGKDPAKVVGDFGARAPLLHIKDGHAIKGEPPEAQLPAGTGVVNFPDVVRAGAQNIRWMIVEFDAYSKDIVDGIRTSYAYLATNGLGVGRAR